MKKACVRKNAGFIFALAIGGARQRPPETAQAVEEAER